MTDMKIVNVRLPAALLGRIEAEARARGISKSDVVRERLESAEGYGSPNPPSFEAIADLIGSVDDDLPADLSSRKKHYLAATGYGRKRRR